MLQNDYLVAKTSVDTAENEPWKESCGRGNGSSALHAVELVLAQGRGLHNQPRRGAKVVRLGPHARGPRVLAVGKTCLRE